MRVDPFAALTLLAGCAVAPAHHIGPVTDVVFDGGEVFACSQAGVRAGSRWVQPSFRATSIDVCGSRLLAGGGDPGESGSVALYSREGRRIAERTVADDMVYSVSIHPDGESAAVGCADGSVRLLSLPTLKVTGDKTRHTAPCRVVRFSTDGKWLATGGLDGLIYLHDLASGVEHVIKDHTAGIECLIFHNGHIYSGARDGKVRLHDRARLVRTYQCQRQPVVALTVQNNRVIAGLSNGQIQELHPYDATCDSIGSIAPPLFTLAAGQDELIIGRASNTIALPMSFH